MKRSLLLGWILLAAVALGAAPNATRVLPDPPSLVPPAGARVAAPTADTLRHRVAAGDDLIATLPDRLNGRTVTAYAIARAPALSWLVDRSLLWRTRPEDVGTHALLVEAAFDSGPPDTLTVLVDVAN